ncbi:MAG: hypothetical protein ACXU86_14410 [Archangium sp.]
MRLPLRLLVLLAGLLVACTTVSPAARNEAVPHREQALTVYGEWHEPADPRPQPRVVLASSGGESSTPSGPRGQPLTHERLLALALSRGMGLSPVPVQRNWEVGMAFQWTICRSLNVVPNSRAVATPERSAHQSGIPDGVLPATRINILGRPTFRLDGAFLEVIGPESFLEVKALKRPITLSTGRGQIEGFIKALARQRPRGFLPGALEPPRPALLLVTPVDTQVTEEVADEAGRHGVALFHAVAWEDGGRLTVGPFRQLTGFADVAISFSMPSVPEPLRIEPR